MGEFVGVTSADEMRAFEGMVCREDKFPVVPAYSATGC
jgi:hypothetical protein